MKFNVIVAYDKRNGGIGKDNQLVWKLSRDLKNFKSITKLVYYSYLENDYQYSDKVIKLFDTYLNTAKVLNDFESYIIFAEKKSEILKKFIL